MNKTLDTSDLLQLAAELEHSGEEFYNHLAAHSGVEIVAGLCRTLAEEEARHAEVFRKAREALHGKAPERMWSVEEYGYLNALVDSMVLNDPADGLSRVCDGNVHSLLDMAIQIEKDTILFYTELHAMVGEDDGGTISAIIREEKQHLKTLTEARAAAG